VYSLERDAISEGAHGMDERQDHYSDRETRGTLSARGPGEEISFIELINTILKHRWLVIVTPLIVFVLIIGITFLQARTWSTSASFLLQNSSSQGSLTSSIAAQFGMSIPTAEAGQSPQFYAELIMSREILRDLAENTYRYLDDNVQVQSSLSDLLRVNEKTPRLTNEMTIQELEDLISATTDLETSLVSFTVETRWAEVSEEIARNILDLVNQFNLETRQTQATAERVFVEERLNAVEAELRTAEDDLQEFLQQNRQWTTNPELEFIHDRLSRKVIMRQQVFTTLNQAYEQARIDEVRDTPVITIIKQPEAPALPDKRGLVLKTILSLLVGGILGIFGAFGREYMIRGHQLEADQFEKYELLKRETLRDVLNPLRLRKK